MNSKNRIINRLSVVVMSTLFAMLLMTRTAYAEEIEFSKYSTTYGYEQLGELEDGKNKQQLYAAMYETYEAVWDSQGDYDSEVSINQTQTGYYIVDNLSIYSYGFDANDVMEVHIALMFDNPLFYYIPSAVYTSSYVGENTVVYVSLVVDKDYNEYSERTTLNSLILDEVEKYKNATDTFTNDYGKINKVYGMLMDNMTYSYDESGNPSGDVWAHNVIGALQKNKGVCESYAKTFQLIMNYLGHESYIVAGVSYGENHAWNLVELEGNYYYVDATWDDGLSKWYYFLKGSTEFEVDHTKNTSLGEGISYLYDLPKVAVGNYENYLQMSYNGGTIERYDSIAAAFADMKDSSGSYVITVPDGYNASLPSGQWPVVKEITIIGNGSKDYFVYSTGNVELNCNVTFRNTKFATVFDYIIKNKELTTFEIGSYKLTLENTCIGGYVYRWKEIWGKTPMLPGPGVNIIGSTGSELVCLDDVQMEMECTSIDVENLIIDGAFVITKDCDINANKLILRDSKNVNIIPALDLHSTLNATKGIIVNIDETIVGGLGGYVHASFVYKNSNISLGNVDGDNLLGISVHCLEKEAYPDININNSQVDIYFTLSNMRTTTIEFIDYLYAVWEDAIDYNDGYLNIGSTSFDKIKNVGLTFYQIDENGEPIVDFAKSIELLCDVNENGDVYRKHNEIMRLDSSKETVLQYIFYKESTINTVSIPKGVITIGGSAFEDCKSIQKVILPEGLYHIEENAFVNCSITEITLPSTLYSIGEYAIGYNYDKSTGKYIPIDGFKMIFYEGNYAAKSYAENNGFVYEEITVPKMVSGFGVSSKTDSKITLIWEVSEGAHGYIISRQVGHTSSVIATIISGSTTKYTVSGLGADDKHTFIICPYIEVEGEKILGNSDAINVYLIPQVEGFTYSNRTTDSISLKWNEVKGALGYRVEQYVDGRWSLVGILDGVSKTTCNVKYLNAGTNYIFRVCAYKKNSSGNNDYGIYTETTIATVLDGATGFTYSGRTASTVSLKWEQNYWADGYVIEQYKGGKWTVIKTITTNGTTSHKVTGLSAGTSYKFRIRAYKFDGTTTVYSSYTNKTVKTLPSTVKNFTVKTRTTTTITLKWTKNTSADGYVIQQYKGGKWVTIKTITKNSTVSYKVTGLKAGTTYKFRIRSYDLDGSKKVYASSYTTKSIKTLPSTVKSFTYKTRTKTTITLKWAKNTSATGYVIQQYKGGKWKTIKTITKNSTVNYKVTGLKKATTYKFRIKASNKDGNTKLYSSYTIKSIKTL